MLYDVKFSPGAEKDLKKLPDVVRGKVVDSLLELKTNPFSGKKLKGKLKGFYSLRIWPYRIIYCISNKELVVLIIKIGHRKDVYSL